MSDNFSIGQNNLKLLAANKTAIGLYLFVPTVVYVFLELFGPNENWLHRLTLAFSYFIDFILIAIILRNSDHISSLRVGRFFSWFVYTFLFTVIIAIGFVAFILPGIYLMARLIPGYVSVITSNEESWLSIGWSWVETGAYWKPITKALLGPLVLGMLVTLAIVYWEVFYMSHDEYWPIYEWASTIFTFLATAIATVWMFLIAISSFDLITRKDNQPA